MKEGSFEQGVIYASSLSHVYAEITIPIPNKWNLISRCPIPLGTCKQAKNTSSIVIFGFVYIFLFTLIAKQISDYYEFCEGSGDRSGLGHLDK